MRSPLYTLVIIFHYIPSVPENLSAVRFKKPADQFHDCVFSCIIQTYYGYLLSLLDLKGYLIQNNAIGIG